MPQIIESNIPDSTKQILDKKEPLWIAINYTYGCTLMSLIDTLVKENINIPPIDCIHFCQRLLQTVKTIHSKGVMHRDIKPANIIVQCGKCKTKQICGECKAILLDYGLAHNRTKMGDDSSEKYCLVEPEEVTLTLLQETIGNVWSRVPQMAGSSDIAVRQMTDLEKYENKQLRRTPTIDASSICAILFTLLARKHPGTTRNDKGLQPHHRYAEQLHKIINTSLTNSSKDNLNSW